MERAQAEEVVRQIVGQHHEVRLQCDERGNGSGHTGSLRKRSGSWSRTRYEPSPAREFLTMAVLVKEEYVGNVLTTGRVRITLKQTASSKFVVDAHMPCGNDWIVGPQCPDIASGLVAFDAMVTELAKRYKS